MQANQDFDPTLGVGGGRYLRTLCYLKAMDVDGRRDVFAITVFVMNVLLFLL